MPFVFVAAAAAAPVAAISAANWSAGDVEVDGSPVHVTLCDTAGQNTTNASALRELCYPGSDVFLVCFSVVNPETFRSVQTNWIPTLTKQHRNATVILIGTQSDLRNDHSTVAYLQVSECGGSESLMEVLMTRFSVSLNPDQMQGEKPVSVTDAWDYARSIGAKYVETSSRTKVRLILESEFIQERSLPFKKAFVLFLSLLPDNIYTILCMTRGYC